MSKPSPTDLLTMQHVANELGYCKRQILRHVASGMLPAVKLGQGYFVTRAAMERHRKAAAKIIVGKTHTKPGRKVIPK